MGSGRKTLKPFLTICLLHTWTPAATVPAWTSAIYHDGWPLCKSATYSSGLINGGHAEPAKMEWSHGALLGRKTRFQKTSEHMSSGQNFLLPAMDMAKVGGPLSVVKVFAQMSSPLPTTLKSSDNFVGNWYQKTNERKSQQFWGELNMENNQFYRSLSIKSLTWNPGTVSHSSKACKSCPDLDAGKCRICSWCTWRTTQCPIVEKCGECWIILEKYGKIDVNFQDLRLYFCRQKVVFRKVSTRNAQEWSPENDIIKYKYLQ